MAMTDARKRANAKWDAANRKSLACRASNEEYAAFKSYAESHGKTVSGMLLAYVRSCIAEQRENNNTGVED